MIASLTSGLNRLLAVIGRFSMYRVVLLSLSTLAVVAVVLSFFQIVVPTTGEILLTAVVLAAAVIVVDQAAQRIVRAPVRVESSLITALILLFVVRPSTDPAALAGLVIAAAAAAASKYLLVWRGRHIFNPAAVGATVVTIVYAIAPTAGILPSAWWVGSPALAAPVILLGLAVLVRTEKVRVVGVFLVVAVGVYTLRTVLQSVSAGFAVDVAATLSYALWSSPFLFLGAFMLSEPLTLPPRRWQQYLVALVVGVLTGWAPIVAGGVSLGYERALLVGNLLAFLLALRAGVRVDTVRSSRPTPSVRELVLRARRPFAFRAGQYLELHVPHRRPDGRGTRREFSIVSAPEDLPTVRIAYRDGGGPRSSFKRALSDAGADARVAVTGVWGDFVLPRDADAPILMVAAGIGVTPFVSQLRHLRLTGSRRDVVLVYVASTAADLAYRSEIAETGTPVIVYTRDEPQGLPAHWTWAGGERLGAEGLGRAVPDLARRHAYVSGPPGLIADLAPALGRARSLTTDAFAGY
ncbi:flavodoxin reductase [Microbacterium betulae]|uniref:Flavodoxin reductase n=1 Tax=Microbacterium betulae TaxID=2981139 RepID=A0AA97FJR2_9MICO|nr:flavodoxin reductase [Microbacterium sp. AB]WOF24340.1 flavodoxin reductase [Microbacterium sp. AB]